MRTLLAALLFAVTAQNLHADPYPEIRYQVVDSSPGCRAPGRALFLKTEREILYSRDAFIARLQGSAKIKAIVKDGSVRTVSVTKSAGSALDEIAMEAV